MEQLQTEGYYPDWTAAVPFEPLDFGEGWQGSPVHFSGQPVEPSPMPLWRRPVQHLYVEYQECPQRLAWTPVEESEGRRMPQP